MRFLYTVCFYILLPLILLRLVWRGCKAPQYWQRWLERFGFYPHALEMDTKIIWLHSVSVGETIAAAPLVHRLLLLATDVVIVVTTTTPTGSAQVQRLFAQEIAQGRIQHSYIPYDLPGCIRRFLLRVKPQLAIFIETELWPNIIHSCQCRGIPTVLANGRLSERSYNRYQKLSTLAGDMFAAITSIAAQGRSDAERMRLLGASEVVVTGNIKSTVTVTDTLASQAQQLKRQWSLRHQRDIIIAASTHEGEESLIFSAYQVLLSKALNDPSRLPPLLLIVPRHPERFNRVKQLAVDNDFNTVLKSQYLTPDESVNVIVGDSMGELMLMYGAADIAVVGGSFIDNGGHNMLEPAAWGLPIISGASTFNFADISQQMCAAKALTISASQEELVLALQSLLYDDGLRQSQGRNAKEYLQKNQGALDKLVHLIGTHLH